MKKYIVEITELKTGPDSAAEANARYPERNKIYEQEVNDLNILDVIKAVNGLGPT